jgi:hypothetical protein
MHSLTKPDVPSWQEEQWCKPHLQTLLLRQGAGVVAGQEVSRGGNDTVRIIDSFSYNGEMVVELRLHHLMPVVDEFVVTEARETHSGVPKNELFIDRYRSSFQPYMSKARCSGC